MLKDKQKGMVDQLLNSGVEPFTLSYQQIFDCTSRKPRGHRARLLVNTNLGVLEPEQYEYTTNRTNQCIRLFEKALEAVIDSLQKQEVKAASSQIYIYTPSRMIQKDDLATVVREVCEKKQFSSPERLVFEFPAEVLWLEKAAVRNMVLALRKEGVHTAVSSYGCEYCPVTVLAEIPFNTVILHQYIAEQLSDPMAEKAAIALITYARSMNAEVIATNIGTSQQIESLMRCGCQAYFPSGQWLKAHKDGEAG